MSPLCPLWLTESDFARKLETAGSARRPGGLFLMVLPSGMGGAIGAWTAHDLLSRFETLTADPAVLLARSPMAPGERSGDRHRVALPALSSILHGGRLAVPRFS